MDDIYRHIAPEDILRMEQENKMPEIEIIEQFRDEIASRLSDMLTASASANGQLSTNEFYGYIDRVLSTEIDGRCLVIVEKKAELPLNPYMANVDSVYAYDEAQQDMLKAGYKKVVAILGEKK